MMFREMRRKNRELPYEECIEILKNESRGVLAVLGDYDYPYTVPMTHAFIDGKIYFHGAQTGHKKDAIKKHEKVSYCVMDKGVKAEDDWWYTFRSVIVFGKIRTLTDSDDKIEKLTVFGDKFFPTHEETVSEIKRLFDKTEVFEISIDHISGKRVEER